MFIKKYWDYDLTFTAGAAFVFLVFINIARLRPWLAPLRPTLAAGALAILLILMRGARGGSRISLGLAGWCWLGLAVTAYLSAILAPKGQDIAMQGALSMVKSFAAYFIVYNIITSVHTLKGVYWVWLFALMGMLYFAFKVMVFTGGRLSLYVGPFFGVNETALGMAMFLPFCLELAALRSKDFRWNRAFLVMSILCVILILRTFSRGGFLALTGVLIVWTFNQERKWIAGVVTAILVILMVSLSSLLFLPSAEGKQSYVARIQTILKARRATEQGAKGEGRIECAKDAIRIWKRYPILGIGQDCYDYHCEWDEYVIRRDSGSDVHAAVHNSLLEVLMELGLVGFVLYVALLLTIYRSLVVARRWPVQDLFLHAMMKATWISFIGWFIAGLFLSEQFNWCLVLLTGLAAAARKVCETETRQAHVSLLRAAQTTEQSPEAAAAHVT